MSKTLSFFDRLVVFLTGLLLLAAGLVPVAYYWEIPYVSEYLNRFDRESLGYVPDESWYRNALIAAFVVLLVLGAWFFLANIRSRAFSTRDILTADSQHGESTINVARVASAACEFLEKSEMINQAKSKVAVVGNRPTARFTVTADPSYSYEDLTRFLEAADEDFRLANHTMEIDTVWELQLDRITA
ncbi:alkaline shock response membrane anchor protein AmaP [Corynebacterium imitans]|uniref:alkaline shock response membrane anchor protein AmaP n=1 Tax=Corynebacterium imitans TaxID=156978 RepID=UPI001EF33295|nr:alkaline shock response membrane anchor protein AmaP [Corynebacterium imitans]MCG7279033.1 alkaline shock response membrane anchor protein AmaP [Corynebacterium imitans]